MVMGPDCGLHGESVESEGRRTGGLRRLYFLGPQGSFTHQAAIDAARFLGGDPQPCEDAGRIIEHVEAGEGWGVIAWENNVEGYVVPNLDMLIDSADVAGCARLSVDISFDAFVRPGDTSPLNQVCAHPHGLAQCRGFARRRGLEPSPASSNAAACRDIRSGQVALGPSICGELYGLTTLEEAVQDYEGASTDFLVVAPRGDVMDLPRHRGEYETVIAFVPLSTGPGVLADLLDVLRDAGLNMTGFISRPIKGRAGTYSFIATVDAAPWQSGFRDVLERVTSHGDWVKTLAVYPRRERPHPPVDAWMLPRGGVRGGQIDGKNVRRELLW